jgi:release factor glutamine methyltransferase
VTIRESWLRAKDRLASARVADSGLEAEVLLRHALGVDRAVFFSALGDNVTPDRQMRADSLVGRRAAGEPLAYILENREFYGLDFLVNSSVLVPRQETELLVDNVLEFAAKGRRNRQDLTVADIGTGSGAIAVAIARNLPQATVSATDSSREALVVADVNRRRHGVVDRVHLRHGDLLQALPAPVDVLVSNPPYLRTVELAGLAPEVRREPIRALDGGPDGLDVIRRLFRQASGRVRPGGLMAVEVAPQQLEDVTHLARSCFPTGQVSHDLDLSGLPRVVCVAVR